MTARSKALIVAGAWTGLATSAMVFALLNRSRTSDLGSLDSVDFVYVVVSAGFALVSAIVGFVVAGRTNHPIGWLLLAFAVTILLPLVGEQYAFYGIVTNPGSLPMPRLAAVLAYSSFSFILPALVLILVLFPSGKPRSSRWRTLVVLTPLVALFWAGSSAVQPSSTAEDSGWHEVGVVVPNDLAIEGVEWIRALPGISGMIVIGLFLAAVLSILLRFRGSRGIERQQIKWLAFVAMAAGLTLLVIIAASTVAAGTGAEDAVGSIGWALLVTTILLGLPLAVGASILRYRLYDIDRIISRTLSYAVVSALLGGTFALLVLVPTAAIGSRGRTPDWMIAIATLVVAALFRPVRRRVQEAVDHRFNRRRYDAAQLIEGFAARLRLETDMNTLRAELQDVVTRSVQPSHVSLWLRPDASR